MQDITLSKYMRRLQRVQQSSEAWGRVVGHVDPVSHLQRLSYLKCPGLPHHHQGYDFKPCSAYDCAGTQGLDHVMFVTAVDKKLLLRQYHIQLKRSGTKVPRVELLEMGPSLDLTVRRTRPAPEDLMKEALKLPKLTAKKVGSRSHTFALAGLRARVVFTPQRCSLMP